MTDYEVKGYIVRWHDVCLLGYREQTHDTEEAALEHYKELLEDTNAYNISLNKVLTAISFPWDED